jgi:hypothetical protein
VPFVIRKQECNLTVEDFIQEMLEQPDPEQDIWRVRNHRLNRISVVLKPWIRKNDHGAVLGGLSFVLQKVDLV